VAELLSVTEEDIFEFMIENLIRGVEALLEGDPTAGKSSLAPESARPGPPWSPGGLLRCRWSPSNVPVRLNTQSRNYPGAPRGVHDGVDSSSGLLTHEQEWSVARMPKTRPLRLPPPGHRPTPAGRGRTEPRVAGTGWWHWAQRVWARWSARISG
jgi:hypothetical protein